MLVSVHTESEKLAYVTDVDAGVDGRPNSRNIAVLSNFSGEIWTGPKKTRELNRSRILLAPELSLNIIAPAGFWPRGQNPKRHPRSPRVYTYKNKEYLLPPQGFGPEGPKTRGGTLGVPACIHTRTKNIC